jgi:hypothetical protein
VLGIDFFDALTLPEQKLHILYNESRRQRMLDLIVCAKAFGGGKDLQEEIQDTLSIHGDYTEGFYDDELNRLFGDFKK